MNVPVGIFFGMLFCLALLAFCAPADGRGLRLPDPGTPGAPADARYCGEPRRDANGVIIRSEAVKRQFAAAFPKPDDGRQWHIDHVIPLASGGCDLQFNLQWLPTDLKSCAAVCKDRWERWVYRPPVFRL